jgi:hypothetical protein
LVINEAMFSSVGCRLIDDPFLDEGFRNSFKQVSGTGIWYRLIPQVRFPVCRFASVYVPATLIVELASTRLERVRTMTTFATLGRVGAGEGGGERTFFSSRYSWMVFPWASLDVQSVMATKRFCTGIKTIEENSADRLTVHACV